MFTVDVKQQHNNNKSKSGSTLKGCRINFFLLREDLVLKGFLHPRKQTGSHKSCFPVLKNVGKKNTKMLSYTFIVIDENMS